MTNFGEKLKQLRRERGWSQDELAKLTGIHGRQIGKYEVGGAMPNADTIIKIAKVFAVSTDYLLFDQQDQASSSRTLQPLRDENLFKKFEALEKMPNEDKQVIVSLIDAYIKKLQIEALLQQ